MNKSIGSTKGIHNELKTRGDKGFQDAAQSSIQSGLESALGSIRGAGGIGALANQAGIKAQSDSNALRAHIAEVGGGAAYIGLNEFSARKGAEGQMADRDAFNSEFFVNGMSAYRKTATSTGRKQYSEMKGTARAFDELGSALFDNNAYANTNAGASSTGKQIDKAGGNISYIQAAVTSAVATQGALMSAVGQPGGAQAYIDNAQYEAALKSRTQTKNRQQDIKNKLASDEETDPVTGKTRKTDTKITSDLGEARLQNEAIKAGTERQKVANRKATEADKINAMFRQDSKIDKAATLKDIGITENDLAAGANMSDDALKKIKLHQEKKMEKSEFIAKDVEGHNNAVTMRTGYTEGDDKKLRANSEIENSSSFRKMEMGEKTDFHAQETVESAAKQTAVGTMGSSAITAGEAFEIGAFGAGALAFAGKNIENFKNHFASAGSMRRTKGGGFAVKAEDGNWFESDKQGNQIVDEEGKPKNANKRLQPSSVTALKGMTDTLRRMTAGESSSQTSKSSDNSASHNSNSNTDHSVDQNKANHINSSSKMHNYNASEKSAQGVFEKISKYGGKALGALGIGYEAHEGYQNASARHAKGDNVGAAMEVGKSAGVIGMGIAGAETGAAAGASIGALFGGVGAVPGAFIGGIAGGAIGAIGATSLGNAVLSAHDTSLAQAQHHTAQQQFQASTATTGSFPALQQAMASNPINVNMQSSPQQMASSISVADAVAATRTSGGVQMTASDVQQNYQMTHATNTSASYIKEVSRSMNDMLSGITELVEHFSSASEKASGKVNDKA